jgi:hypothetical protein
MTRPLPKISDHAMTIIRALEAARSTRTPDGKSHAIIVGGRHVEGRLFGTTATRVFIGHHEVPSSQCSQQRHQTHQR